MAPRDSTPFAVAEAPRRLVHQNLSFLRDSRLRRILELAGHDLRPGLPRAGEGVLVWGRSPTAARGERAAAQRGAPLVRVEDAFLRSIRPGRAGRGLVLRGRDEGPLGLMLDPIGGVHFDPSAPSALEQILAGHPLDESHLLGRARVAMDRIAALHLSKYNLHDPDLPPPAPGYVLVVDQTRGDASVAASVPVGTADAAFAGMLACAMEEHPRAPILIRSHPETALGLRPGHFAGPLPDRVRLHADPVSPRALLEGAVAVYTLSSQLGFEAILAGHRPVVFGQPFYAGWGLTDDRAPALPRRGRRLTKTQLFAAAMILAPLWYDPCRDRLCQLEDALNQLEAEVRAFRQDRCGHVAAGMRLWKRGPLQQVFGRERPLVFRSDASAAAAVARRTGRGLMVWAGRVPEGFAQPCLRVEDGFLRSRGLGAALVPPLSLVTDDLGIYYDPRSPSRLEALVTAPLPPGGRARAEALVTRLVGAGVTKYNPPPAALPPLPEGRRILVPGQVEDDASLRHGGGEVRTNAGLLAAARAANPGAVILYKPHPDVAAGLRPGALPPDAVALADAILPDGDPAALLSQVDEVWTMTSLLGFEALLRGRPVTTLGAPFYAGWGLTRDLGPIPARRLRRPDGSLMPRPDVVALAHAALIAYPRYFDPVSRRPCPPEVVVDRLADGPLPRPGRANRLLSKLQGMLASQAWLWR